MEERISNLRKTGQGRVVGAGRLEVGGPPLGTEQGQVVTTGLCQVCLWIWHLPAMLLKTRISPCLSQYLVLKPILCMFVAR